MTMNLISTNRNIDQEGRAKADWTALTAISAADSQSPYPSEGYVRVDAETVVAIAALLEGAVLQNGETVTTYDFSGEEDGSLFMEAHVEGFGPGLLDEGTMASLRTILAPFPHAIAMLDEVVTRGLQCRLSTETLTDLPIPHLKAVNWPADEVEINRSASGMISMLRGLGLGEHCKSDESGDASGEIDFETFAKAVETNGASATYPQARLQAFVACARRQSATHVHWA